MREGLSVVALLLLFGDALLTHDYHLENSREFWSAAGTALHYYDHILLTSKKLRGFSGFISSQEKLESTDTWDLVIDFNIEGDLTDIHDGIVINLAKNSPTSSLASYDKKSVNNFGFMNTIEGAYIILTQNKEDQRYAVRADYVDNPVRVSDERSLLNQDFKSRGAQRLDNIVLGVDNHDLFVYFRYKDRTLEVFYKLQSISSPVKIASFKDSDLTSFYISMSASISGEPTQIKALSAFFKSDKENNNIKYFTDTGSKRVPKIFKYIDAMYDMHLEHESSQDTDINLKKLRKKEMLDQILGLQQQTITNLYPSEKIADAMLSEVGLISNYLENHLDATNDYFSQVIKKVDRMIDVAKKEFTFVEQDVKAIVKTYKNNKIGEEIKESHEMVKAVLSNFKSTEERMKKVADKVSYLKGSLDHNHGFMDVYENIMKKLPQDIVD